MNSSTRPHLLSSISRSWNKIQPSGTLETWLPYHPMSAMDEHSFEKGLEFGYEKYLKAADNPHLLKINALSIQWLPLFFDEKQAAWPMPGRTRSLYLSVLNLYFYQAQDINKLKEAVLLEPLSLIEKVLESLSVVPSDDEMFFDYLLYTLPGWAGFVCHESSKYQDQNWQLEYLALRCYWAWEYQLDVQKLFKPGTTVYSLTPLLKNIADKENQIRAQLCEELSCRKAKPSLPPSEAHFVFCMDTRSGPLRDIIEQLGPYTTDGLAGFWGLDIALVPSKSSQRYHLCPTFLKPTQTIKGEAIKASWQTAWLDLLTELDSYLKKRPLSLLCWVECFGIVSGALSLLYSTGYKTLFPENRSQKNYALGKTAYLQISFELQIGYAVRFLKNFSFRELPNLIIICGHGSLTLNNIFAAKLQCGACGNYRGLENARLMVQILNDKKLQEALKSNHGFDLSQTLFAAAEHDTVTDAVVFDEEALENINPDLCYQLKVDLKRAQHLNALKRLAILHGHSYHWAETRPEWGLAGHQGFIIGPSWWTSSESFQGKIFLHSYDFENDTNHQMLTGIFQGPVNVAYLLNMQYFFPSFDQGLFSAGNKMLHQLSMLQMPILGNGSDLMLGLPLQSIAFSETEPYHQPVRLLVIVYAQLEQIIAVLLQQQGLRQKFENRWIFLSVYDPIQQKWFDFETMSAHLIEKEKVSLRD